ncbi:MAG TPA: hypothetical protein VF406_05550 [Thermodesulfobacteriota bacterium]
MIAVRDRDLATHHVRRRDSLDRLAARANGERCFPAVFLPLTRVAGVDGMNVHGFFGRRGLMWRR